MSFQVRMSAPDLKAAYNAVRDGDPETEWALYTYLDRGGDLVVQETGAGGLETLCTKFSPERVQHAFARVEDPRMHGDKFILIHWCGDNAPAGPRRFFAINSGVISSFLKGAQVTFTASDEHDISPEAIMKRLIGQGTASEVPRAPARSMFRRATEGYRPPQRLNSSYVPEKPVVSALKPSSRATFSYPVAETTYSPILTEEPEEMGDPFDDPVPEPPRRVEPQRVEPQRVEPQHVEPPRVVRLDTYLETPPRIESPQRTPPPTTTTAPPTTTTAPPASRPINTRGMTWGERLAAKRRQDTVDGDRSVIRLNTVNEDVPTLTWSQRQALAKQRAEEEDRARQAELEFQENERKLKELEAQIKAENDALEAQLAQQEEEERLLREHEERLAWEQEQRRQEEIARAMEEERQRGEMERKKDELRRLEQLKAERQRQEELSRQLERERVERERHQTLALRLEEERKEEARKRQEEEARRLEEIRAERQRQEDLSRQLESERRERESMARRVDEERKEEARKRKEEAERYETHLRQMEALRVEAEKKEQLLRAEAARREREAEEQLKLAQLRLRQAEEERLAVLREKEEDEAHMFAELERIEKEKQEELERKEREERERKLQLERQLAEKRETDTIRAEEIQRLTQRVRELELRREAAAIEERSAKLRQEQEKKKRMELEEIAKREREEKERLLRTSREEEARRQEEEEARFKEFEELHNRVMQMERLALDEGSARDRAAAAEKEIRQRLRQAEERAARLLAEKESMLRRQQEEQARIRVAAEELARRRSEPEVVEAHLATPEMMPATLDAHPDDAGLDKKRRIALPKRQPNGWTPLQGNSSFSFERAARTLVRMGADSPRESAPYLKTAAKDLSSFFVVDYGVKPQSDFVIQLPHH